LVFIGNAIGDVKAVKGRMYALSADKGDVVWETYLIPKTESDPSRGPAGTMPATAIDTWKNAPDVPITGGGTWTSYTLNPDTGRLYIPVGNAAPDFVADMRGGANLYTDTVLELDAKTGAYINNFPLSLQDWHDWDASNAPVISTTRGGKRLLSLSPKNGHVYGFDLASGQLIYKSPVNRIENADAPFSRDVDTHFCPGVAGGGEWNGVAYDPRTNLVLSGEEEWCTTIRLQTEAEVKATPDGQSYTGNVHVNPLDLLGMQDPHEKWGGWLYGIDADDGVWKWRVKTNYPSLSGLTPTAGGVVFFGDIGGNFYAVNSADGALLWSQKLDGALGGGVITYSDNGSQRVAVASGMTSILLPTQQTTAKILIFGL
jgi:alcohol dehydrogenase (cytochrome c)